MKILFISDLHSNYDALNAVWEKEYDSDYIVFAGDLVDFGFNPKECVQWFMDKKDKLFAVRGNHDEEIITRKNEIVTQKERNKNFQTLTLFELGKEGIEFLELLPHETTFTIDDIDFYMSHTVDENDNLEYLQTKPPIEVSVNLSGRPIGEGRVEREIIHQMYPFCRDRFQKKFTNSKSKNKVCVFGHSHIQWLAGAGSNCMVLNPGSLSYRFIGNEELRCADYIVYQDGFYSLRHVEFDTSHLYKMSEIFENKEHTRLAKAFYRPYGVSLNDRGEVIE